MEGSEVARSMNEWHELQHGGSASGSWVLPAESPSELGGRGDHRVIEEGAKLTLFVYIGAQHLRSIVYCG